MEKFGDDDIKFLKAHFEIKPPEAEGSGVKLIEASLDFPIGEVTGPVDAGKGSHYFVYLPKTLREGREAPLMFVTESAEGNKHMIEKLIPTAELNGIVLAVSVENKNELPRPENHNHTKNCIDHLLSSLPIQKKRIYFMGGSGGGAMSFYNALRIKSAGNMPINAYSPDKRYPRKQYCIGLGGTTDFNRYHTASAVAEYDERGMHRFYIGAHVAPPVALENDGITWLNGQYLGDLKDDPDFQDERLDYEVAMITFIESLRANEAHRAYYWCDFLQKDFEIEGGNATALEEIAKELRADSKNIRYCEGLVALNEFSRKYLAPEVGAGTGAISEHTTPEIQAAAEELAERFAGVPEIEALARELVKPSTKI